MHIRLFHKTNSRSQRILWLLEELNLDYELIHCDGFIPTQAVEKLANQDSSLKFPTLHLVNDHFAEVISLTETAAIADYLSHQFNDLGIARLSPSEVLEYYFWKNFAEATFMPEQEQSTALFLAQGTA